MVLYAINLKFTIILMHLLVAKINISTSYRVPKQEDLLLT